MPDVQLIQLVPKSLQDRIGDISTPSLKRNVLTQYGKRWQLWGNGIRGAAAEEVIDALYGPHS